MQAYIYQAALLCEECGEATQVKLGKAADTGDSDDYPQGPYDNGGGESDSPAHCDVCQTFLENPLTGDGWEYLLEQLREKCSGQGGDRNVLLEWANFYGVTVGDMLQEVAPR